MASGIPRHGQRPRRAYSHPVERLEERLVLSSASPTVIAYKVVTDRDNWMGAPTNLEGVMDSRFGSSVWRREIARAVQTWAEVANIDFTEIPGSGSSRSSDILIGGQDLGAGVLGVGYLPTKSGDTITRYGDVILNTASSINLGKSYDLYSLALHELGHAIGLEHNNSPGVVMNPVYQGTLAGLTPSDVAAVQAIYGPRQPDRFNAQGRGTSMETAVDLALNSPLTEVDDLDITHHGETDIFSFVAPGGTLTATVGVDGVSLLSPQVRILDASGRPVGQASNPASYGDDVSISLNSLVAGQRYFVTIAGATPNDFDIGGYNLTIRADTAGGGTPTTPTTPTNPTTPTTPTNPTTPPVRPQVPTTPTTPTPPTTPAAPIAPTKPTTPTTPAPSPISWRFAARERAIQAAKAALASRLEVRAAQRPFLRLDGRALGAFTGLQGRLG